MTVRAERHDPAYVKLRDELHNDIVKGKYRPGQWLPTEQELIERTGLSRHTVRAALDGLREAGLISRHRGRGTCVTWGADDTTAVRVTSSDQNLFGLDLETEIELLQPMDLIDDPHMAKLLAASGTEVAHLRFYRHLDGVRIGLWHLWMPVAFYDDAMAQSVNALQGTNGSLLQKVEAASGRVAVRADQLVTAGPASDNVADILGIATGDALLRMERTYFDQQGYPLEHVKVQYVPKYFSYRLQLLRTVDPGGGDRGRASTRP
jgi:GntR family transcriptional regulator